MFVIHRIVFFLNVLAILALLGAYAAPYISPEFLWYPAFLGLAYPVIVVFNIACVIYWVLFLKFKALASLLILLLGWNHIPKYVQFGAKKIAEEGSRNTIQVITFNTRYFGQLDALESADTSLFLDKLQKLNPDILCAQEFHVPDLKIANSALASRVVAFLKKYDKANGMPGNSIYRTENVIIFSKHRIVKSGLVERENNSGNFSIYADIVKANDTIRIVNTHLQSIGFAATDYRAIRALMGKEDSLNFASLKGIGSKMKYAYMLRAKQVDAIRAFIDESPYPVVLCGDFNDSPVSYAYRQLKGNLSDAFVAAASGLGRTYIGNAPSLRIDYILYDNRFEAYDYYAKGFDFSDHKLVSCKLRLSQPR